MGFNFDDNSWDTGEHRDIESRLAVLESNMKAITHELEIAWEAINELQGVDPEKAGEPDA